LNSEYKQELKLVKEELETIEVQLEDILQRQSDLLTRRDELEAILKQNESKSEVHNKDWEKKGTSSS
jgi:hypothetical protein